MAKVLLLTLLLISSGRLYAGTTSIAVASNFIAAMTELVDEFGKSSSHTVRVSYGSSGKLYAQIKQGAPFDILLSADQVIPERLVKEGLAQASSRYTYAQGRLVLWTAATEIRGKEREALESGQYRLSLANPRLAPYGVAAIEVLESLGIENKYSKNRVEGENIGQAFQFVYSKNAELGLVSLSQLAQRTSVYDKRGWSSSEVSQGWLIPQSLYNPIYQDAVRLNSGLENKAASDFWVFLMSRNAKAIIQKSGYLLPMQR